jgi:hypothetical protein
MTAASLQRWVLQPRILVALIAGFIAFITGGIHPTPYNNYVLLAQAFLQGHTWIEWPGPYIDALPWNGAHYIIEAPLPAILLMPFVYVFGVATSQSLLGVGLVAVAMGTAWTLLERLNVSFATRCWLALFLFAGTDLWWCASLGGVWFIAHLASVAATLLALNELAGRQRPSLVAFWGCCAVASRFSLILALPVYALLLLEPGCLTALSDGTSLFAQSNRWARIRKVLEPFTLVVLVGAIAWVRYNIARWGVPYDIGYTTWYHQDQIGESIGSPFQLKYLPMELHMFFVALPHRLTQFPWFQPDLLGQALEFTSPALLLSFFARGSSNAIRLLWLATALVAFPSFVYYTAGAAQFGMRHALDFEPFLFVLMALAVRKGMAWWGKIFCAYSAFIGCWGVWYWHAIMSQ